MSTEHEARGSNPLGRAADSARKVASGRGLHRPDDRATPAGGHRGVDGRCERWWRRRGSPGSGRMQPPTEHPTAARPTHAPRGDEDELYRRHHRDLERAVAHVVNAPRELIEDACQTAWAILLRNQPDRDAIFAWLRVVAIHEAYRLSAIEPPRRAPRRPRRRGRRLARAHRRSAFARRRCSKRAKRSRSWPTCPSASAPTSPSSSPATATARSPRSPAGARSPTSTSTSPRHARASAWRASAARRRHGRQRSRAEGPRIAAAALHE